MQATDRSSNAYPNSLSENGDVDPRLACPRCGLTAQELHDHGRMGCPTCYDVFVAMVMRAAAELHGIGEPGRKASPALTVDRNVSPWPTRKALPSSERSR